MKTVSGENGEAEFTVSEILDSPVWNSVSEQSSTLLHENQSSPPPSSESTAAVAAGQEIMQRRSIANNLRIYLCKKLS